MIIKVLHSLARGKVSSFEQLAVELDVTVEAVESMVSKLVQMGYLQEEELSHTCSGGCSGCGNDCDCLSRKGLRTFALTQKGYCAVADGNNVIK